jgi:homoserine trans-succinylase
MSLQVSQGEKGLVKPNRVTAQDIIADIVAILNKINTVLSDHEQRLHLIEELDLKIELELLRSRILAISDQKKQTHALQVLKNLCDTLEIADLEAIKS